MDALSHMLREAGKLEKAGAEHGWDVRTLDSTTSEGVVLVDCTARRGQEVINIWWENKRLLEAPTYKLAGHEVKLRNASACVQQMAKAPNFEKAARKTKARQSNGDGSAELEPAPETLPWMYLEDPTDGEILKACYASTIVWINGVTGEAETDVVVRSPDAGNRKGNFNKTNYHISVSSSGRKILNFLGVFGYRSVALDTILRVGTSREAAERTTKHLLDLEQKERKDRNKQYDKMDKAMR
jgi:hypothetical protein